jgi:hypothetical protein
MYLLGLLVVAAGWMTSCSQGPSPAGGDDAPVVIADTSVRPPEPPVHYTKLYGKYVYNSYDHNNPDLVSYSDYQAGSVSVCTDVGAGLKPVWSQDFQHDFKELQARNDKGYLVFLLIPQDVPKIRIWAPTGSADANYQDLYKTGDDITQVQVLCTSCRPNQGQYSRPASDVIPLQIVLHYCTGGNCPSASVTDPCGKLVQPKPGGGRSAK